MFPAYRIPIIIPNTFKYVKVASSASRPAADASYKNLFWENLPVLYNMYHNTELFLTGGKVEDDVAKFLGRRPLQLEAAYY